MRVAVISHTYVVHANRGKLESLARLPEFEILLIVPKTWWSRDIGQRFRAERQKDGLFSLAQLSAWSMGSGSLITYSPVALWWSLRRFRPDLVHLEEEPWSLAALELVLICRAMRVPLTFFTWENGARRLPLPFRLIRRWMLRSATAGMAGNAEAQVHLRKLGFTNSITVLPQLGVDIAAFQPARIGAKGDVPVIGYVGRLVHQKGILVLLEALARLSPDVRLMMVGKGPLKDEVLEKARSLGVDRRMDLHEGVDHHGVPQYLQKMSILVLPSLTTPGWKEQFGHVLIEAMACGVPVIASDSGAIPEVLGDAGIVVPEGNVQALASAIQSLLSSPSVSADLAARGRARVLAEYTNDTVGFRLAGFWQRVVGRAV